jgi:beta-N-acetylhexosaminidase
MKRGMKLLALLLLIFTLPACGAGQKPSVDAMQEIAPDFAPPIQQPAHLTPPSAFLPPAPEPDPVEERLAAMSTQEKLGQLLVAGIEGPVPGEDGHTALVEYKVGGIILFLRNVEGAAQLTALVNDLKALNSSAIPLFMSVDEEGGRVSRMPREVTDLQSPFQYAADGGDPVLRGKALATLCSAFGFNLDYAPVLDVWSNPGNTVIGDRAFGSTWQEVTALGTACAQGMIAAGVIPVVKHFPGHGDTLADSHQTLPVVKKELEQLMEEELLPFRVAIEQGVPAVMVAHILMEQLDEQYPATLSSAVVDGLLRENLGFDGLVCTDDLTMGAISNTYSVGEAAVLAVEAGCDLLLVCHKSENLSAAYAALLTAMESGRITQERLNESVRRILRVKEVYGLHDKPVPVPDVDQLNAKVKNLLKNP